VRVGPYVAVVLDAGEPTAEEPLRAALPISDPTPGGVPEVVQRVAQGTVSVLITGETGSGKEVLARTIHELSGRKGQLVAINCASLSETLLESELFGYERGAFTGATLQAGALRDRRRRHRLPRRDRRAAVQPAGQAAARARDAQRLPRRRVKPVALDVRFVAATHRKLLDDVARGRFRQDLYFRVNGIMMSVLPLRERRDAIPRLAEAFLAGAMQPGRAVPRIVPAALSALTAHPWPGNVRELRTVMERARSSARATSFAPTTSSSTRIPPSRRRRAWPRRPPPSRPSAARSASASSPPSRPAPEPDPRGQDARMSRTTLVHKLAVFRIPRPRTSIK
jgi:two-component system response regulator GlrR